MVGHRPGRWKNILSLLTAALAYAGVVLIQGRIREKPSLAWLTILNRLDAGAGRHFHLWRFARYCSQQGIDPSAVNDGVIAGYQRDLEAQSLVAEPARSARDAARFWNSAADASSEWPQQRLSVPDNRTTYALPWAAYPASLHRDVEAWLAWLGGSDPFIERDFSPLRPKSVATRLRQLREYLAGLVHQGVDPQDLVDLAAVVTPARAQQGLRILLGSGGAEKERAQLPGSRSRCHDRAPLGQVGEGRHRSHPQYGEPASSRLGRHDRKERFSAATARRSGTTELAARPTGCPARGSPPERCSKHAIRPTGADGGRHRALASDPDAAFQPLRAADRRSSAGRFGQTDVHFDPAARNKNEVALEASLPEAAATLIAIYLERYRPLLTKAGGDWMFPGARLGSPKTEMGLRGPMQKALATRCGLLFNPHLFRHMAAWLTLRQNPGAHGQVQRILGHKSLSSTMAFYSGLEGPAALQHYDRLVSDLRDAALGTRTTQAPVGSGRMSAPRPLRAQHRALPLARWPAPDRDAWDTAHRRPDFLEIGGHGASWRPASQVAARGSYGRWLGWLKEQGVILEDEAPADRITSVRVRSYITFLQQGRSTMTVASYLGILCMVVLAIFPENDWHWLKAVQTSMQRRSAPSRNKRERLVPADQLMQLGLDLTEAAKQTLDQLGESDVNARRTRCCRP